MDRFGVGFLGVVSASMPPDSEDREPRFVSLGEEVVRCSELGVVWDADEEGRQDEPGDMGAVCQVGVCGAEDRGVLLCDRVVCFRLLLRSSAPSLRGAGDAEEEEVRSGTGERGGRSMAATWDVSSL